MTIHCVNITVTGDSSGVTTSGNVAFPATQVSSGTPNTLDDYEEGAWTPSVTRSSSAPSMDYYNQSGYYRKIGSWCYCSFAFQINSISSYGSGNWQIGGLPFTALTWTGGGGTGIGHGVISFTVNHPAGDNDSDDAAPWGVWVEKNTTRATFKVWNATSAGVHRGQIKSITDSTGITHMDAFQGSLQYVTAY